MELGMYLKNLPPKQWIEARKQEGVKVHTVKSWAAFVEKREILLLTDVEPMVVRAAKEDIPVIYYQEPGCPNVYQGDMTVLELEEVDGTFLERVFRRHRGLPWQIAETERLLIRESVLEDFEGIWELYKGQETMRFLENLEEKEAEREKLAAYIRHQYPFYGYGLYSVLEKKSGELVGRIGFENREYEGEIVLELGYLIREDRRRLGYAMEAACALEKHLEELTGEGRAMIFCHKENTASIRTAKKLTEKCPSSFQICFFP